MPRLSVGALPAARLPIVLLALPVVLLAGCELADPEVAVRNDLDEPLLVANISYGGCYWPVILAPGETTTPCRCLPGQDRVHFQKHDASAWPTQTDDDGEPEENAPLWFPYQTDRAFELERGDFRVLSLQPGAIEQDFTAPGPYGH